MPEKMSPREMSTPALAYFGDSVVELLTRRYLVESGISSASRLNSEALKFVSAAAQSEAAKKLLGVLTDEESAVFRRGRNTGHSNVPKSVTPMQYRMATGFETLFAYLWLCEKFERAEELFKIAYLDSHEELK